MLCYKCSVISVLLLVLCYKCSIISALLLVLCNKCSVISVLLLVFCYCSVIVDSLFNVPVIVLRVLCLVLVSMNWPFRNPRLLLLFVFLCRLLISFANSLDPDQARQNDGPGLDPNCLTIWWNSWRKFSKNKEKLPSMNKVKSSNT